MPSSSSAPRRRGFLTSVLLALTLLASLTSALKFDLQAFPRGGSRGPRCIRNFVSKDTLVVVTATVSGTKGDGQKVDIHIRDAVGNEYGRPKDVVGEARMAFTSHADAAFDVCFENHLDEGASASKAHIVWLGLTLLLLQAAPWASLALSSLTSISAPTLVTGVQSSKPRS